MATTTHQASHFSGVFTATPPPLQIGAIDTRSNAVSGCVSQNVGLRRGC